jgi:hypothetical protein
MAPPLVQKSALVNTRTARSKPYRVADPATVMRVRAPWLGLEAQPVVELLAVRRGLSRHTLLARGHPLCVRSLMPLDTCFRFQRQR